MDKSSIAELAELLVNSLYSVYMASQSGINEVSPVVTTLTNV